MKSASLKPREDRRLLRGHLWAYRNEFQDLPDLEDGELVDLFSAERRLIGRGFYQAQGGIAVRILDRHQSDIGEAFWRKRIEAALALRRRLFPNTRVYRWAHGESDGLPGLAADRYDSVVSVKTPCGFYRRHAPALAHAFLACEGVDGVRLECAEVVERFGAVPESMEVFLDGVRLGFSLEEGQKTGLYLDQRENCRLVDILAQGARALDAHCYIGQWSCRALKAGAASVLGVDTSPLAVEWARKNAALNGGEGVCRFECADVEEILRRGEKYDLICLDPPALAKTRAQLPRALGLYQALNAEAMRALAPGGCLITSSCSQPVSGEAFLETLKRAARAAQRSASVLALRGAPPDHPVLLAMPETAYLTCAVIQVR